MLSGRDLMKLASLFQIEMDVDGYERFDIGGVPTIVHVPWRGEKNIGHWVAVFTNNQGNNYFDSYGGYPDELIVEKNTNDYDPRLSKWLLSNKEDIIYNDHNFQKNGNSCGVWSFIRILFKDLTDEQFEDAFKEFTSDELTDLLIEMTKKKLNEIN